MMEGAEGYMRRWSTADDRQELPFLNLSSARGMESMAQSSRNHALQTPLTIKIPEYSFPASLHPSPPPPPPPPPPLPPPPSQTYPPYYQQWPSYEWTSGLQAHPMATYPVQQQYHYPQATYIAPDLSYAAVMSLQNTEYGPELAVHHHYAVDYPEKTAGSDFHQPHCGVLNANALAGSHLPHFLAQNQTMSSLSHPGVGVVHPTAPQYHQAGPTQIHGPEARVPNYPSMAFPFPQSHALRGSIPATLPSSTSMNVGTSQAPVPSHVNIGTCQAPIPSHVNVGTCQAPIPSHMNVGTSQALVPSHMNVGICQAPVPSHVNTGTCQAPVPSHVNVGTCQAPVPSHMNVGTCQAPVPSHVNIGTCQAPVPSHMNVGTAQAPVPSHVNVGTAQAPVPSHVNVGTAQAPVPSHMNVGTCQAPVPSHMNVGTCQAPVPSYMNVGTCQAPVPSHMNVGTCQAPVPSHMNAGTRPNLPMVPMNAGSYYGLPTMVPSSVNMESRQALHKAPAPPVNTRSCQIQRSESPANSFRSTLKPARPRAQNTSNIEKCQSSRPSKERFERPLNQRTSATPPPHRLPKASQEREDKISRTMGLGAENRGPHCKIRTENSGESRGNSPRFQNRKTGTKVRKQQSSGRSSTVLTETNNSNFRVKS